MSFTFYREVHILVGKVVLSVKNSHFSNGKGKCYDLGREEDYLFVIIKKIQVVIFA